jgi:hypothetical protein
MKATTNRCLKVIRDLAKRGEPITSQALRDALGILDTDRSTALDIAAGWISTLRRYGFLKVARGEKVQGPRRQIQVYRLTDWGMRYKAEKQAKRTLRIAANPPGNQG